MMPAVQEIKKYLWKFWTHLWSNMCLIVMIPCSSSRCLAFWAICLSWRSSKTRMDKIYWMPFKEVELTFRVLLMNWQWWMYYLCHKIDPCFLGQFVRSKYNIEQRISGTCSTFHPDWTYKQKSDSQCVFKCVLSFVCDHQIDWWKGTQPTLIRDNIWIDGISHSTQWWWTQLRCALHPLVYCPECPKSTRAVEILRGLASH